MIINQFLWINQITQKKEVYFYPSRLKIYSANLQRNSAIDPSIMWYYHEFITQGLPLLNTNPIMLEHHKFLFKINSGKYEVDCGLVSLFHNIDNSFRFKMCTDGHSYEILNKGYSFEQKENKFIIKYGYRNQYTKPYIFLGCLLPVDHRGKIELEFNEDSILYSWTEVSDTDVLLFGCKKQKFKFEIELSPVTVIKYKNVYPGLRHIMLKSHFH